MEHGLERLNELPDAAAEAELLACGGATRWVRGMVARRPFRDRSELFAVADELWRGLGREDWLEAFSRHPQIGEKTGENKSGEAAPKSTEVSRHWSAEEQSGVARTSADVRARVAAGNRAYQQRFGYIFIVCATGKTAEEMLALLDRRLQNDPAVELPVAAEEQRRIMHLRLEKLLAAERL